LCERGLKLSDMETSENRGRNKGWDNLKPFQPGQSGNPGGRPKRKPVTELYEEILNDPAQMEALKKAIGKALLKGNMAMVLQLKEMTDRVEGKVSQPIEADITVSLPDAIAEARKRASK
jgi:hypothetical protein